MGRCSEAPPLPDSPPALPWRKGRAVRGGAQALLGVGRGGRHLPPLAGKGLPRAGRDTRGCWGVLARPGEEGLGVEAGLEGVEGSR